MTDESSQPQTEPEPPQYRYAENDLDHGLLRSKLNEHVLEVGTAFGQTVIRCKRESLLAAMAILRDDEALAFDMHTDITAVDNLRRPDYEPARRFTMIHVLYSTRLHKRVRIETDIPEQDPTCPSASPLFKGAHWTEREVYDMFGIEFSGHPDLRRILLPDYFEHHPLRKDYPLTGRGERDNFVHADEIE